MSVQPIRQSPSHAFEEPGESHVAPPAARSRPRRQSGGKTRARGKDPRRELLELERDLRAHFAAAENMLRKAARRRLHLVDGLASFDDLLDAELAAHLPTVYEYARRLPAPIQRVVTVEPASAGPSSSVLPAASVSRRPPSASPQVPTEAAQDVPPVLAAPLEPPAQDPLPDPPAPEEQTRVPSDPTPRAGERRRLVSVALVASLASFLGTVAALGLWAQARPRDEAAHPAAAAQHTPGPMTSSSHGVPHGPPPAPASAPSHPPPRGAAPTASASADHGPTGSPIDSEVEDELRSLVELTRRLPQPKQEPLSSEHHN